jgi:hypothetical protein
MRARLFCAASFLRTTKKPTIEDAGMGSIDIVLINPHAGLGDGHPGSGLPRPTPGRVKARAEMLYPCL